MSNSVYLLVYLNLILLNYETLNAHKYGAPQSACLDMMPQHNIAPQIDPAPYRIITETNHYSSYDKIKGCHFFFLFFYFFFKFYSHKQIFF